MILDSLIFENYNIYVWPAFIFTFMSCIYLFLNTKKELKKIEIMFSKEIKESRESHIEEKIFSNSPVF